MEGEALLQRYHQNLKTSNFDIVIACTGNAQLYDISYLDSIKNYIIYFLAMIKI